MDPLVFGLILLSAAMHATWNTLLKTEEQEDRLVSVAVLAGIGMLAGLPVCVLLEPPARAAWPFMGASAVIHIFYCLFLIRAYREGDLSSAYPLARGSAPPLVALGSLVLLGEQLDLEEWLAVTLISVGILSLVLTAKLSGGGWRPLAWALATGAIIATYSLVDGTGVRRAGSFTGSAFAYLAWLNIGWSLALIGIALAVRGRAGVGDYLRRRWQRGTLGGVLSVVAYALVLWACQLGALAPIIALRETSVVMAALIGALFLSEPLGRVRVLAATAVAAGAILLQLA